MGRAIYFRLAREARVQLRLVREAYDSWHAFVADTRFSFRSAWEAQSEMAGEVNRATKTQDAGLVERYLGNWFTNTVHSD